MPPGCDACTGDDGGGLTNIIGFIANALPEANFGLISSIRDGTIAIFYAFGVDECSGFGIMPGGVFEEGLFAYRAEQLSPNGWGSYLIPSTEHVWTQDSSFYNTEVGGVLLTDWLEDLLGGGERGRPLARSPWARTDPDVRYYRIRLQPRALTPKGWRMAEGERELSAHMSASRPAIAAPTRASVSASRPPARSKLRATKKR